MQAENSLWSLRIGGHSIAEVVVLTQFFPPETGAGARRVGAIGDALGADHSVTVVVPRPGYPSPDLFVGEEGASVDARFPGVVVRAPQFAPYSHRLVVRALRESLMSLGLASRALSVRHALVLVSTPSMFLAPFGWLLARLRGSRFVWDLRDLTWRYSTESIQSSRVQTVLAGALERLMIAILRRSDLVVTTSEGGAQELVQVYGLAAESVRVMRNGVSKAFFDAFGEVSVSEPDRATVLYLGLLGHNHGIDVLVDAARLAPEVKFVIIGDGTEKELIARKIEDLGVMNVKLHGYLVENEQIIQAYRQSDILFNHSKDRRVLNDTMIPAKFPEYMATGRPIVFAGKGISADVVSNVGCGVVCPPGDPEAIILAIRGLWTDPSAMSAMGRAGREYVRRHFLREVLCRRLVEDMERRGLLAPRAIE